MRRASPFVVEILGPLWPRIAGKPLAQHCHPVTFRAGELTLATDCSSWAVEVRRLGEEIRAEINSFLGAPVIKKLRIQYAPNFSPPHCGVKPSDRRTSKLENRPELEAGFLNLESRAMGGAPLDAEMARVLQRSFGKYFARKGGGSNGCP